MSIYLNAKHWQLFIVLVGSMFLGQAIMAASMFNGDIINPFVIVVPTLVMGIVYFGWLWAVASACSKALPRELFSSPRLMKIGLIYALVYVVLGGTFFFGSGNKLPGYIVVPHLMAMAAVFYGIGFTAKQLVKLDQKENVSFFTYSGPFFLFWFFPIGVWFIQPKVNQLLGNNNG